MLVTLFRTAGQFDMQVQPQLVLLQKTLLNIEGLGRQLYPELNLWDTAKPFLEQWVAERYSLQNVGQRLQQEAPALLETLPLLPDLILQPPAPDALKAAQTSLAIQLVTASGDAGARWHWVSVLPAAAAPDGCCWGAAVAVRPSSSVTGNSPACALAYCCYDRPASTPTQAPCLPNGTSRD